MSDKDAVPPRDAAEVIRLEDLAPRKDVKGGSGPLVFGEGLAASWDEAAAATGLGGSQTTRPRRRP